MKNKETIEEAAEKYNDDFQIKGGSKAPHIKNVHIMNHFIAGAKWQQERMYSEEEVKMLAFNFYYDMSHKMGVAENLISENRLNAEEWFEQFKKHKGGEQ